jgi:hypothetical protein
VIALAEHHNKHPVSFKVWWILALRSLVVSTSSCTCRATYYSYIAPHSYGLQWAETIHQRSESVFLGIVIEIHGIFGFLATGLGGMLVNFDIFLHASQRVSKLKSIWRYSCAQRKLFSGQYPRWCDFIVGAPVLLGVGILGLWVLISFGIVDTIYKKDAMACTA